MLTISAAAVPSIALASAAASGEDPDLAIRILWQRYDTVTRAFHKARAAYLPHRELLDAQISSEDESRPGVPRATRFRELASSMPEYARTQSEMYALWTEQFQVAEQIHAFPTISLFGIGVKLSALPCFTFCKEFSEQDMADAAIGAMRDIDRALGTRFAEPFDPLYTGGPTTSATTGDDVNDEEAEKLASEA